MKAEQSKMLQKAKACGMRWRRKYEAEDGNKSEDVCGIAWTTAIKI
jgi:hypothetical protein